MIFGIIFLLLGGIISGTTISSCVKLNEYPIYIKYSKINEPDKTKEINNIYIMNTETYKNIHMPKNQISETNNELDKINKQL